MPGGWYYDSRDGNVALETGVSGIITDPFKHLGLGWHGPFGTLQGVVNFYNNNAAHNPGWVPPQIGGYLHSFPSLKGVTDAMKGNPGALQQFKNQLQGTAGAAGKSAVGAVTDVSSFLSRLTSPNTWLRIGEFILGLAIFAASVAKLTGVDNAVAKAVNTVGGIIP